MLPQALRRVPARPGGLPAVGGAEPKQTATSPGSGTSRRYRAVAASTSRPGGQAVRASGRAAGPPGAAFHARQSGSLPGLPRRSRSEHPAAPAALPGPVRSRALPLLCSPALPARRRQGGPRNRHLCGVAPTYRLTKPRAAAGRKGGRERAGSPVPSRPCPAPAGGAAPPARLVCSAPLRAPLPAPATPAAAFAPRAPGAGAGANGRPRRGGGRRW